jgi:hypothetical protein
MIPEPPPPSEARIKTTERSRQRSHRCPRHRPRRKTLAQRIAAVMPPCNIPHSPIRVIGFQPQIAETGMAMNARKAILSHLAAGAGRRLRTASICLLAIAASISIHASVPPTVTPARPATARPYMQRAPRAIRMAATRRPQPHRLSATEARRPIPSISNADAAPFSRRIFVEGAAPPAEETLTALLQGPMTPDALPRPESPALRTTSASPSNRQRAP